MKWFAWPVVMIFILVVFAPAAQAQIDSRSSQIQLSFEPGQINANATIVNMADQSTAQYEKDVVLNTMPNTEGKYFGPYLKSSLFQFSHKEGYFQIVTNFTISSQVIMNGATSFWLRVPIIPSQYSWWHLWCDWGYANSLEGSRGPVGTRSNIALPWNDPLIEYFGSDGPTWLGMYEWDSGNVWSTKAGDTYQIKQRETGLYIRLDGIFRSNELFTLSFTGVLNVGESPMVFLTQERNSVTENQTFRFFQTYENTNSAGTILDWGYKYDINQTIGVAAAWAFLFTSGMGKDGMVSYHLQFGGTGSNDYLMWGQNAYGVLWPIRVNGFANDSHLSFYMPFSGNVITNNSPGLTKNTIDWHVTIMIRQSGYGYMFDDDGDGFGDSIVSMFFINNTKNYLLFSTPEPVVAVLPTLAYVDVVMTLFPMQPCDLILLGVDLDAEHSGSPYIQSGYWTYYRHEDERASWDPTTDWLSAIRVNAHIYPLYNSFEWTDGLWAAVNETKLYWIYDFGWGMGYSYSNTSTIYLFLDNGGQYLYNGSFADFINHVNDHNLNWWQQLLKGITDFVGFVGGKIWDGLQWIWQTLKNLGTWIYNVINSIYDWIMSIAMDIGGKVGNIIEGMLYGMPIVVILFAVNYVGSALYQGHIPKLTKERRLLRKMRPRAIKKRTAKYERRLKYPIVQAQKARKDVRAWRIQRSEHRTARYESSIHRSRQKELKYQEEKASLLRRR